jgi:basic membrane protein A and related proteins
VRRMRFSALVLLALALAVLAAAVTGSSSEAAPAAKKSQNATVKIAVVTDIGGLNDRSFNHLANVGRLAAQQRLGVQTRIYVTNSAAQRVTNLAAAARAGYGLVIGVGFLMGDPLNTVAPQFPNTKFAGVDVAWESVKSKPKNVRGLLFKEQEAGYLVGYLSGLEIKRKPFSGQQKIAAIGAINVPPIVRYMAGYKAGALKANPQVNVISGYANDPTFNDQSKCRQAALNDIANGAGIIFQVAGGCGLGALDAAKSKGAWGIGVDNDQSFLGPHILTSAVKKVDIAVFNTIKAYKANPKAFRGGFNAIFDVASGGVGYGKVSPKVPKSEIAKVEAVRKLIAAHKVAIPQK